MKITKPLFLASIALLVVGVFTWLMLDAFVAHDALISFNFTYADLAFGVSSDILGQSILLYDFSIGNLIGLILLAIAVLLNVGLVLDLKILGDTRKDAIATSIFSLASGIMMFFARSLAVNGNADTNSLEFNGIGFLVPIVVILAAGVLLFTAITNKE